MPGHIVISVSLRLLRFKDDAGFKKVAERLMAEIMRRDQEDGDKLAKGIQLAIDKKASRSWWYGWVMGRCGTRNQVKECPW